MKNINKKNLKPAKMSLPITLKHTCALQYCEHGYEHSQYQSSPVDSLLYELTVLQCWPENCDKLHAAEER